MRPDADAARFCIEHILKSRQWSKQREIVDAVFGDKRITAVRSCFGAGKTRSAADIALAWLVTGEGRIVVTTAPTARQVKELLWKEIRLAYRRAADGGNPLGGDMPPLACELRITEGWIAIGFSSDDPVNVQGWHAAGGLLVVIDEAMGIPADMWQALNGIIVGENDRMLAIGNPTTADGPFYEMFAPDRSDVAKITISAYDTPNVQAGAEVIPGLVTRQWVEWAEREYGRESSTFKSLVLGDFPTQGTDALIPREWIALAQERWARTKWETMGYTLGLDVARLGPDSTIGALRNHQGVKELIRFKKAEIPETVGMVARMLIDKLVIKHANVDADGLGAGVHDGLKLQFPNRIREMRGGMTATNATRFNNRRSEWFWNLRKLLDPGGESPIALPPDDRLAKQLSGIHWRINPKGQTVVEEKDEIKKRLGHSPDEADAVAYACADFQQAAMAIRISAVPDASYRESDFYVAS